MPDEPDDVMLPGPVELDHAIAIARAISAWANFEYAVDEEVWAMAGVEPEIGACMTAQLSTVVSRFDALISLAHVEGAASKDVAKLNQIKESAAALAQKRNRLVHDPWFFAYESRRNYRLQRTAKGRLISAYQPVTTEELQAIEEAAFQLTGRVRDLCRHIRRDTLERRIALHGKPPEDRQ